MLVQEIPPGQERLSGLEDLGLCLFKGLLLHGASHKKAERKKISSHSSTLAIKNKEYKNENG